MPVGSRRASVDLSPDRLNQLGSEGWETVGLTLKKGDLIAWPVVLLKHPVDSPQHSEVCAH